MADDSIPTNKAADSDSPKETTKSSMLLEAIEKYDYNAIESALDDGADVNEVLISTGPQAGCTALHIACLNGDLDLVTLFVDSYDANVNVMAEDGTQPLHISCFVGNDSIGRILLEAGANVNLEFNKEMLEKYVEDDKVWSDDFGGKLSMLAFAIINNDFSMMLLLTDYDADVAVKSGKNKTLLMYAIEEDNDWAAMTIAAKMTENDQEELLNARDDEGRHAIHYILHEKKYGGFRYDEKQLRLAIEDRDYLKSLIIRVGPDAYAAINGDPDTLLINSAAYRSCFEILNIVLPRSASIEQSKALSLATSSTGDPQKYLRIGRDGEPGHFDVEKEVERRIKLSLEAIVKDLQFRRTFGLAVPEEEIKLLDELIAKDDEVRNIVKNYHRKFINKFLRKKIIHFGDKSMNFYELTGKIFDDQAGKILAQDKELVSAVEAAEAEDDDDDDNLKYFFTIITARIEKLGKEN
ncbi:uncharacterized protein LOC141533785 [Cotesia typhae]|uniref:uncharacterized protein LOC141533785 n=1 Tax=Cotesia typhae TaxID=2053667 RepID=UPI003D699502